MDCRHFDIGRLDVSVAATAGCDRLCYMLMYQPFDDADIVSLARQFNIGLAVVTGFDWDNDLTPWPAEGQPPGSPDFEGRAQVVLDALTGGIMPAVEKAADFTHPRRTIAGVSLSGLFAVWAWCSDRSFTDMISISGSMWYDGFAGWVGCQKIEPRGTAYFSLGDKEGFRGPAAFRTVRRQTDIIIGALKAAGQQTLFELTAGNHYAPTLPRLEMALRALSKDS